MLLLSQLLKLLLSLLLELLLESADIRAYAEMLVPLDRAKLLPWQEALLASIGGELACYVEY